MWHDHLFNQRKKATKRAVGWRLGGKGEQKRGVTNIGKIKNHLPSMYYASVEG